MDLHIGKNLLDEEEDAYVGNYHSVDRNIRKLGEILAKGGILVLARHSIECQVNLYSSFVGVKHGLRKLLNRKIIRGAEKVPQ